MRVESFGATRLDVLAMDINNFCIRIEKTCVVVDIKVFYCGHDSSIPGYVDDSYKAVVLYRQMEKPTYIEHSGGNGAGSGKAGGGGAGHG